MSVVASSGPEAVTANRTRTVGLGTVGPARRARSRSAPMARSLDLLPPQSCNAAHAVVDQILCSEVAARGSLLKAHGLASRPATTAATVVPFARLVPLGTP